VTSPAPARRERPWLQAVSGEAAILDGQWACDHWDAGRLGIPARRGRGTARFDGISQPWLRGPVKRWSRFRLATGCAFATIDAGALALTRFSRFLATRHPQAADASAITRPVLEDYLSWLVTQGYSASTRALSLSMIRVLFDACHRHGWLPGLAAAATIYVEELPFHHDEIARFIPEFVMAQLESSEAIAKIPHATTRNLVIVLIETGLRGGDACNLPFNPVLADSSGWPCLRFEAVKVRAEQLIPLSARAAAAIAAQQDHVRARWPGGSPWLFPGIAGNDDGSKPYSHSAFTKQLAHWQRVIGLHDESGQPVTVTGHQFRHTLRNAADQLRRPPACGPEAPRPRQPAHDQPLRQDPRRHHPGSVRPLPVPAGEHRRRAGQLRPRLPGRLGRVGQAPPEPRPRQPAERLLRPPRPAGLPAPKRLPDLPGLPDHARVPADPPAAGRQQQPSHRASRGQGTAPSCREPAPRPGQPGSDHPRPGSARW